MVVGAAVGAIGGAVTSILTAPECPPRTKPILVIGDSLAVGLGPQLGKLSQSCGLVRFGLLAEEGSHVMDWGETRFNAALATVGGSVAGGAVVISLGGNDLQADPVAVQKGIDRLVGLVRAAGATPRWIAPPAMAVADTANVRARWRRAVGFDAWRDFYPTDEVSYPVAPDGIHPTTRGYTELATAIWHWLAVVQS